MRNVKLTAGIAATVLSLLSFDAMAQGPGAKSDAAQSESTFKGVVVSMNPLVLAVKGAFGLPDSPSGNLIATSKGKSASKIVPFVVKNAKVTRGGWRPVALKDLQKGQTVCVVFTPPTRARSKLVATQVDITGELSAADKEPILGKTGKLLFEDDFSRSQMLPKWRPAKGFWEIHDGVVTAAENPDDHHGAVAHLEPSFPYKDIVAEFSFKFAGSTSCAFVMDDSTYKGSHAGHIIRAGITPTTVTLADSKFGGMKNDVHDKMTDPKTTEEEKKRIQASVKDKSATFKIALDPAKWHQARVEVVGDEMLISMDCQPVGYFKSEGVDHPTKNKVGIAVAGKSVQLNNVKIWEATPREDWSKNRSAVQEILRKQ